MKKGFKQLLPILVLTVIVHFSWFIPVIIGIADPFISGFAVDSSGRVYIEKIRCIEIYSENQQIVDKICPKTSRGYNFTVQQDDTVLLATPSKVYIMDTTGEVINSYDDSGAKTYSSLQNGQTTFVCPNGDSYTIKDFFGVSRIMKNNAEIVYQITSLSLLVKLFLYVALLCYTVLIMSIVREFLRANPQTQRRKDRGTER